MTENLNFEAFEKRFWETGVLTRNQKSKLLKMESNKSPEENLLENLLEARKNYEKLRKQHEKWREDFSKTRQMLVEKENNLMDDPSNDEERGKLQKQIDELDVADNKSRSVLEAERRNIDALESKINEEKSRQNSQKQEVPVRKTDNFCADDIVARLLQGMESLLKNSTAIYLTYPVTVCRTSLLLTLTIQKWDYEIFFPRIL